MKSSGAVIEPVYDLNLMPLNVILDLHMALLLAVLKVTGTLSPAPTVPDTTSTQMAIVPAFSSTEYEGTATLGGGTSPIVTTRGAESCQR